MKKFTGFIPLTLVVAVLGLVGESLAVFQDVPDSSDNYTAINYVQDEGIVSGYPDGLYRPGQPINRAEFTKIMVNSVADEQDIADCLINNPVLFPDVPGNEWFAPFICLAKDEGVIDGYPDGTFRPADLINFAEASKIIVNAFGYELTEDEVWYIPFVQVLSDKKAIPTSIPSFDHSLTRGEMAEMIYRLLAEASDLPSLILTDRALTTPAGDVMADKELMLDDVITPPDSDETTNSADDTTASWWKPVAGLTWDWQLTDSVNETVDVDVIDIDLFDNDKATVDRLKASGKKVICYMSAGSWEDWREDKGQFPASVLGNDYDGWPGEKWLDIREIDKLAPIMLARMDLCAAKGFDGLEPDNIQLHEEDTGFDISADDQLAYNKWLADEAHKRGLSIGLKNDGSQAEELLSYFDWALTEECFADEWCDDIKLFADSNKPVFMVEYTDRGTTTDDFCPLAKSYGFSGLLKKRDLDSWNQSC